MKVHMAKNKIFPLTLGGDTHARNVSLINDNWWWHHRFGHLSFKNFEHLEKKNMVHGLLPIKSVDEVYESYVFGKQHWDVFSKRKVSRDTRPIELVHIDVCELMRTSFLNNNKYFVIFMDDFIRMSWVYFAKEKL